MSDTDVSPTPTPPEGILSLLKHWKSDVASGFLVFLIALPLCLGIALASGYPAIAGVFTAIVGALVSPWLSNSELTIKGPAAGLIVIAVGAINELGQVYGVERAYTLALGVGVAAAALQILFALLRTGILGDFFPTSAVHGMLAAIGVIIVAKQLPVTLGVKASGEPLHLLAQIPAHLQHMNPAIALIGAVSLAILFGLPLLAKRTPWLRKLPAPMVVILVAIPLGLVFDLEHHHTYTLLSHEYEVGENFLVNVPANLAGAIAHPTFEALQSSVGWKWALMFALIGSLESLLSAKAVDMLDPQSRKTNLDRDMLAVGIGNLISAGIGGLPMISEIVRSKANIDNGAKTRFANLWHGVFLLAFVALLPALIHRIPLAALSAMLVYTGFRLASPSEFRHVLEIGREQLLIFVGTLVAVLATDLLIGIGIGIAIKFAIHLYNGVPLSALFNSRFHEDDEAEGGARVIKPLQQAVFSNWIPLRRRLNKALQAGKNVVVDLSAAKLVDHTTMDHLTEVQREFDRAGLGFELTGLDDHLGFSGHPLAARKRGLAEIRRLTIVAPAHLEERLRDAIVALGATGYTSIPARGAGRSDLQGGSTVDVVRLEFLLPPALSVAALAFTRDEIMPHHSVTACVETVEVARLSSFVSQESEGGAASAGSPAEHAVV